MQRDCDDDTGCGEQGYYMENILRTVKGDDANVMAGAEDWPPAGLSGVATIALTMMMA